MRPEGLDDFLGHFLFDPDDVLVCHPDVLLDSLIVVPVVLHDALEYFLVFFRAFAGSLLDAFVAPLAFAGVFLRKLLFEFLRYLLGQSEPRPYPQ